MQLRRKENELTSDFAHPTSNLDLLSNLLHEFLLKSNLTKTLLTLQQEMSAHQLGYKDYVSLILSAFQRGSRDQFFQLFSLYVPLNMRLSHIDTKRIQFYLQLYFYANFSFKTKKRGPITPESRTVFKRYLESKGRTLSNTQEFLPYFGLTAVEKPYEHSLFKSLFDQRFGIQLRQRLQIYLRTLYSQSGVPLLSDIYNKYLRKQLEEFSGLKEQLLRAQDQNERLASQVRQQEGKLRLMLEHSQRLKQLNKVTLLQSQQKWFSMIKQLVEIALTMKSYVPESTLKGNKLAQITRRLEKFDHFAGMSLDELVQGNKDPSIFQRVSQGDLSRSQLNISQFHPNQSLDFSLIKQILEHPETPAQAVSILKALSYKLAKTKGLFQKRQLSICFQEYDVLGLSRPKLFESLIGQQADNEIRGAALRLIQIMGEQYKCREYMSKNQTLINKIIDLHQSAVLDRVQSSRLLSIMMSLSIRKVPMQVMVRRGMIEHYFQLLKKQHSSDSYQSGNQNSYGRMIHLLNMILNLSLSETGARKCLAIGDQMISLLTDLLESSNQDILEYVIGNLYSLFSQQEFRDKAKATGLDEFLQMMQKKQASSQIGKVLQRLQMRGNLQMQKSDVTGDIDQITEGELEDFDEELEDPNLLKAFVIQNRGEKDRIRGLVQQSLKHRNKTFTPEQHHSRLLIDRRAKLSFDNTEEPVKGRQLQNEFIERAQSPNFISKERNKTSESIQGEDDRKPTKKGTKIESNTYKQVFISKPLIPRTPPQNAKR